MTIDAGPGADDITTGDASDRIVGDRGDDTINAGAGDDTMVWNNGDGTDDMNGQDGLDRVEGNFGGADDISHVKVVGGKVRFDRDTARSPTRRRCSPTSRTPTWSSPPPIPPAPPGPVADTKGTAVTVLSRTITSKLKRGTYTARIRIECRAAEAGGCRARWHC